MADDTYRVILWDWKDQPPWDEIVAAQREGLAYVTVVPDTSSDQYAVVMANHPMTDEQAQYAFDSTLGIDKCPGCGCEPGDGKTPGCTHQDGCGFESGR